MRRKISLYIKEQLVELDEDSLVLFNYSQADMENPAIVKNSYSQSIALPKTSGNNAIFGHIGRTDRVTTTSSFNPLKREPFAIYNDMNEIIESGYVKVDSIDDKIHITLYGGLGGYFYMMSYKEDGSKKSLVDLYYMILHSGGYSTYLPENIQMQINKDNVAAAWDALGNSDEGIWGLINFAPAYNGYPACRFVTDKAVYKPGQETDEIIPDLYNSATKDGVVYSSMTNADNSILVELSHNHTELEMQDFRSYLQRPVISLLRLMEAFTLSQNSGDYTFVLDQSVKESDWLNNGWMTLRMFDRDNLSPASFTMADLLSKTLTPADYLISYAKMFGCVFAYDGVTKTITLMTRAKYYGNTDVIDIGQRIERGTERIVPYVMDAKYYVWETENYGEFSSEEEKRTGKKVGSQWVNTNFDFSDAKKSVMEGLAYKGAADVRYIDRHCFVLPCQIEDNQVKNFACKFKNIEEVSWKLYNGTGDETKSETFTPLVINNFPKVRYDNLYLGGDFMEKVQLYASDNKAESGDNVLLFYKGNVDIPVKQFIIGSEMSTYRLKFHLSDDSAAMLTLNDNVPCYDISVVGDNILELTKMPQFLRAKADKTFDFGSADKTSVYDAFWRNYISDRYDLDTKVVTCKVNLSGMQVGQDLMRRFYWFDNSLWVLNKISNYSLTTYDPVECEFVQVKDKNNYTSE